MSGVDYQYVLKFGLANALAGGIAGLSAAVIGQPFDTVKTRMQAQTIASTSPWTHSVQLFKESGLRAFYRGSFSPIISKALSCGVCFSVVASTKSYLSFLGFDVSNPLGPPSLVAYAVSGLIESSFYTPIEAVKVRLQTAAKKTTAKEVIGKSTITLHITLLLFVLVSFPCF